MRIAQGVVAKYEHVEFEEVAELSESERAGGFGSTGLK
jgi:dUTP pyrophosphatase